ncbi:ficolin-1 [Plakobranchus ocellatus]|uniref:Ficolin-1 n=1 Tax=Plakobranchus ocellatus TaxID=259542 RepID=A0AAV4AJP9_9GAST|nr:ficolin-1 [Plakobranchus ocellatus]
MEDKVESQVYALGNGLEDMIDAKLSALQLRIESTIYSLENRIEDKIDAKISLANTDNTHDRMIQRRSTGKVDFQHDWETYEKGFGTLDEEFWLGNEQIHAFTSSGTWELRVERKRCICAIQ